MSRVDEQKRTKLQRIVEIYRPMFANGSTQSLTWDDEEDLGRIWESLRPDEVLVGPEFDALNQIGADDHGMPASGELFGVCKVDTEECFHGRGAVTLRHLIEQAERGEG